MRVLVTGIAGFAGSHLADFILNKNNIKLYGIELSDKKIDNISHIKDKIELYRCDIRDDSAVYRIISKIKPDFIFHLAGQSFPLRSWSSPSDSLITNIIGALNILEAVRKSKIDSRIHIACSSEEYGEVKRNEMPIRECNPLRPLSPYAVGKLTQDMLGYQYYKVYKMFIVRTRAFNHLGARMDENFVISSFSRQIALIEKNRQRPVIYVGNINVRRDFADVRDVVEAYWLALTKGRAGEAYNICSGKGYKIRKLLEILLSFTSQKIEIKIDRCRFRHSDILLTIGDNSKFYRQTGWKPKIPIKETLRDILAYWRNKV